MKWRWLAPLAVIVFLVALVIKMPAANAFAWFAPRNMPLQAFGIEGTLYRGRVVALRHDQRPLASALTWKLQPWWLFAGRVALSVQGSEPKMHGDVQVTPHTLRASGLVLDSQLKPLLSNAGYGFLPVDGLLHLDVKHATFSGESIDALSADGTIRSLRWDTGGQALRLGDFHAHADRLPTGDVELHITTLSGPVNVSGKVTLTVNGKYRVNLNLKPRKNAPATLLNALGELGQPDASGTYHFKSRGDAGWPAGRKTQGNAE